MQMEYKDGSFSDPIPYDSDILKKELTELTNVKQILVFNNTPENIKDAEIRRDKAIRLKSKGFRKRRRHI